MEVTWIINHPRGVELLGYIPTFIHEDDPRTAVEQFNDRYSHGGGWHPFKGFSLVDEEGKEYELVYPASEDGPAERYKAIGVAKLRDEIIIVFEHAWVVILQKDNTWEASRMD